MVSKDLRQGLDAVQSEIRVGYDGGYWKAVMVCQLKVIGRLLRSANKRLLADRSQICKRYAKIVLLADPYCSV